LTNIGVDRRAATLLATYSTRPNVDASVH